jgi:glycosyltransferase involved in cell wall biosynthesis
MNTSNTESVIFVADFFAEDLIGGAELTTEALIESCPFSYKKFRSNELTLEKIQSNSNSYWIFGNWSGANPELLQIASNNLNYSILEYDYKVCKYRSPEKHKMTEGMNCNCNTTDIGRFVGMFYGNARSIFWMSEKQMNRYHMMLPHLKNKEQVVLSSVFSKSFFNKIEELRSFQAGTRSGWIVLESGSWIKGSEDAESWCYANDKEMKKVSGLSPDQLLKLMSESEGLVYLPRGGDTCPRLVIEAKLLGCQLELNNFVEHAPEGWFNSDYQTAKDYLQSSTSRFWSKVQQSMSWRPTISGYMTTKDCISQKYPYDDCIQSMLNFCDEVVVVDGGSTDGTWENLEVMSSKNQKLKVYKVERDWNHPRHAVFDGLQKAEARDRCTMEFCWQMDADEILPPWDGKKVIDICKRMGTSTELISLPVVEYWGGADKVRIDVTPWKWRLSRNSKNITHGIPLQLRRYDESGHLYATQGTDGCDYIYRDTGELVPHASFYDQNVHNARMAALAGNKDALTAYEGWFKSAVSQLPSIRHFSWIDIKRKIRTYKGYWQRHWESLYNIRQEDTAENNKFFDKPWSQVTDQEIDALADKMKRELGGHIFHSKIDWSNPTPWIKGFDA